LRRQEFERRRKELAEQQPKVRPRQRRSIKLEAGVSGLSEGADRTPKKRQKKLPLHTNAAPGGAPLAMGAVGTSALGKSAERAGPGVDYSALAEQLIHQLQQLPAISLQEPEVRINYAVWLMLGTSVFSGGCGKLNFTCQ
jgi:uncharacterized membrane protein YgdD (TMEM256/DUF423 family)